MGKIKVKLPLMVGETEKEAETDFYFLSSMKAPDNGTCDATTNNDNHTGDAYTTKSLTLLLCHPRTGRTHQIRRHVRKAFNAPVVGDSEHGDSRVNRFWRTAVGLDRLALHCSYLALPPPS